MTRRSSQKTDWDKGRWTLCSIDPFLAYPSGGDLLVALDRFEWQVGVTNYVRVKRDVLVEPPSE